MGNLLKILIQIGCFVLALNFWACRQSNEHLVEEDLLAGKALFTGPTPVSQHHGIQVIAYLKSDTTLTPIDTTFTDNTGYYCFGKPGFDGVYMFIAYYRFYYRDTLEVEFRAGRRIGEIPDMHIRQKARIKFTTEKPVYQLADQMTFTAEIANVSQDTMFLPDMTWFDNDRWHLLMLISTTDDSLKFGCNIGTVPGHFRPFDSYEPGKVTHITRTVYIQLFRDKEGKQQIIPGKYLLYATARSSVPLEWNGRIMPIFEPAEVEIVP